VPAGNSSRSRKDLPLGRVECREKRVAVDVDVDPGQVDAVRPAQELRIDIATANDHDLVRIAGGRQGSGRRRNYIATICNVIAPARDYDVLPPRQRPTDGFVGRTAHDQWLAHRNLLEAFEILGQMPG